MGKILKKAYQWYLLYGILLSVCLLYFCFPANLFRGHFIKAIHNVNPQILVSVEDVKPSVVLGLKFLNATFTSNENPKRQFFSAEHVTIRPRLRNLFGNKSGYHFNCASYGGNIKGTIQFEKDIHPPPIDAAITLKNIYIDDLIWLSDLTGYKPKGILNGTISMGKISDWLFHGTGEANLKISNGSVSLKEPFLDLDTIHYDNIQVKLALKNRNIELSHFKMKGQEVHGTLSGTIRLNRVFLKSRLELHGRLELLEALFNRNVENNDKKTFLQGPLKLPFRITGTIEAPEFKFS